MHAMCCYGLFSGANAYIFSKQIWCNMTSLCNGIHYLDVVLCRSSFAKLTQVASVASSDSGLV